MQSWNMDEALDANSAATLTDVYESRSASWRGCTAMCESDGDVYISFIDQDQTSWVAVQRGTDNRIISRELKLAHVTRMVKHLGRLFLLVRFTDLCHSYQILFINEFSAQHVRLPVKFYDVPTRDHIDFTVADNQLYVYSYEHHQILVYNLCGAPKAPILMDELGFEKPSDPVRLSCVEREHPLLVVWQSDDLVCVDPSDGVVKWSRRIENLTLMTVNHLGRVFIRTKRAGEPESTIVIIDGANGW